MICARPIILSGGSGSRLWPLSRSGFPKQFLCLTGKHSLFQEATMRLMTLTGEDIEISLPYVVTNEDHRFLALEQLREIDVVADGILLEPTARNTAPALTLAALAALEHDEDPVLIVTPADQTISSAEAFLRAMRTAIRQASNGTIAILGITPDRPETGYGYIKTEQGATGTHLVQQFVEKPDEPTAEQYLATGGYYWNAGIFVLRASTWLRAISFFRPDIADATSRAWKKRSRDTAFVRPDELDFAAIPSDSIDYAVMERCPGSAFPIQMVPLDAGWSDLGAWDAVWKATPKDEQGNAQQGDVIITDSCNTLVHASNRLVAVAGVSNLIVVETPDAVLVADKARSQDVKRIVAKLQSSHREEHTHHRKVHRPWGWYDSIDEGERFKVKRIQVNPGASLSLQKHHHRAEHWIVVKGTAEITNGEKKLLLTENQSTYIPLGEIHRLANPGTVPLEIIEVQSGVYLGEDDIVRFTDNYGRA